MGQNILHKIQTLVNGCRRIRIREYDSSVLSVVILLHDPEIFIQCRTLIGNPVQIRPHLVKGIRNVRKENGTVRVKESQETQGEHIVRAYSYKHLILSHFIEICQFLYQRSRCRVRI